MKKNLTLDDFRFGIPLPVIEHVLGKREYKHFKNYMVGQTMGYVPGTKVTMVYDTDLARFLRYRKQGLTGKNTPLDD